MDDGLRRSCGPLGGATSSSSSTEPNQRRNSKDVQTVSSQSFKKKPPGATTSFVGRKEEGRMGRTASVLNSTWVSSDTSRHLCLSASSRMSFGASCEPRFGSG